MNIPRPNLVLLKSQSGKRSHKIRRAVCAAGVLTITLLSGCTMLSVRHVDEFEGLDAALTRATAAGGTLRILFVHGMGHHDPGFSRPVMDGVSARLNLVRSDSAPRIVINKESHDYGQINVTGYSGGGKQIRVYELTWSATTDSIKEEQFRTDRTYAGDRVYVNRELKDKLIDDALADPVLYIGRYRNHMQFPIMRAVEAILHDYQSRDELAVVTYSLGSYMCYDTLLKMSRGERIMGEHAYSAEVVRDLIGHTNYMFMLANQLPLLELSEVSNPISLRHESSAAVKSLAEIRRQNRPKSAVQRQQAPIALHLVAFSDPNDLLSYPLDARSVSSSSVVYSNVVVSVARSAIFGVVASPLTAHTGHEHSRAVMDLLAFGHNTPTR